MTHFRRMSVACCAALLATVPTVQAEGSFVALQAGITESFDMDSTGNTFRVLFGPRITERLSFEMGIMDIGKASINDPEVDFSPTLTDDPVPEFSEAPPVFINPSYGSVTSTNGSDTTPSSAVYTGFASIHPQSFLLTLSYRFPLRDNLDFFLKSGANVWFAEYDVVEITATSVDGVNNTVSRRILKTSQDSAVDPITGGGFLWHVIPELSIRAELETTALDSKDFKEPRFQLITLGMQFEF